jgi:hypothetical protein
MASARGREVLHDLDADGGAAKAGLDDVRAWEARVCAGHHRPGEGRDTAGGQDGAEGELVHAEGGQGRRATGERDAELVEDGVEAAVLPGAPVTAVQGGVQCQRLRPAQALLRQDAGAHLQHQLPTSLGRTVQEVLALLTRRAQHPVAGPRPVQRRDVDPRVAKHPLRQ